MPKHKAASTGDSASTWVTATSSKTASAKARVASPPRPRLLCQRGTSTPISAPSSPEAASTSRLAPAARTRSPEL
jgi:hypothetical protein